MKPINVERIEELCEEIWTLGETGEDRIDTLVARSKLSDARAALASLVEGGLARAEGERVVLSEEGLRLAGDIVRRHRLAEVLFRQVLLLSEGVTEEAACDIEHVLSPQVTDSICTYLGHPPVCPHGKAIPRGGCCERFETSVPPLVMRLVDMKPGEEGRIVFITARAQDTLERIAALGVVPGRSVRLARRSPSVVFQIEATLVAVDAEVAREIFVRPGRPSAE